MIRGTQISASWARSGGGNGALVDARTGSVIARGNGSLTTLLALERPTDFVMTADGHAPLRMTLVPEMTTVRISEGSTMPGRLPSFESSYSYPDMDAARERLMAAMEHMNYIPAPRSNLAFMRPSGDLTPAYVNIAIGDHQPRSERVREVQRQLLGIGFPVGAQGADGIPGTNTARSLEAMARWYNGLPERPMRGPDDLSRGPVVAVDRLLTPEKQVALQRFAARASDTLTSLQQTTFVVDAPRQPPTPPAFPWLAAIGTAAGVTALVAFIAYADAHKKRTAKESRQ